ncbi:IpaD/SipD/SspD family type III secretion system needle tip protein [Burkholderia latens]|uniref:IpaD/SipD/SspD family type III secretion system needle tip protein n=1 Tax=Burkholderia latens TaxID=488446 RepID=UPI00158AC6CD|nr:IpaD/SipD/SspD family type III secretion system needle tip protein [Burkholderia latens]
MTAAVVADGRTRCGMLGANMSGKSGACSRDNERVAKEANAVNKGAERLERKLSRLHQEEKARAVKYAMRLGMLMPQVDHRARRDDLDSLGGGLRKFADFAHRSGQEAKCWTQLGQRLPSSPSKQDIPTSVSDAVSRLKAHAQQFAANPSNSQVGDNDNPFQDIIDKLNNAMKSEDGNLQTYEKIVGKVMELLRDLSKLMADIGGHVHSTSDGKSITVDASMIYWELKGIANELSGVFASCDPQDVDQWKQELGPLCPSLINVDENGGFSINTGSGSVLDQMAQAIVQIDSDAPNYSDSTATLNPAAYQAWWTGFQGMESQIENMGQTIAEKYSHRNSNFDNLIKIISSTVQSMVDTSKQFLQI